MLCLTNLLSKAALESVEGVNQKGLVQNPVESIYSFFFMMQGFWMGTLEVGHRANKRKKRGQECGGERV